MASLTDFCAAVSSNTESYTARRTLLLHQRFVESVDVGLGGTSPVARARAEAARLQVARRAEAVGDVIGVTIITWRGSAVRLPCSPEVNYVRNASERGIQYARAHTRPCLSHEPGASVVQPVISPYSLGAGIWSFWAKPSDHTCSEPKEPSGSEMPKKYTFRNH